MVPRKIGGLGGGIFVLILAVSTFFVGSPVAYAASSHASGVTHPLSVPYIAGNYSGSYEYTTSSGVLMAPPLDIQITQNGATLGGTTDEEFGATSSNFGEMSLTGQFTLIEYWNGGGYSILYGSLVGPGQIDGVWVSSDGSVSGTWGVVLVPTISGNYTGSWTQDGESGSFSMQIQVTQVGSILGGTTNEGAISTNTGKIHPDGTFFIGEDWGNALSSLDGTFTTPGQLSGAWSSGNVSNGSSGTWFVTAS